MTRHGSWNTTNTHNGVSDEPAKLPCKASCCKTPYGHSTARDAFPAWHRDACHCHDSQPPLMSWNDYASAVDENGLPLYVRDPDDEDRGWILATEFFGGTDEQ